MIKIGKGLVAIASALVLTATGLAACASPARSDEPGNYPPGVEHYDMPFGMPAVVTWCSHGVRVWQTYHDGGSSYGGNSSLALTSQTGAGC